jgi:hypothetical protein
MCFHEFYGPTRYSRAVRSIMCELARHVATGVRLEHSRIPALYALSLYKGTTVCKGKDPRAYLLSSHCEGVGEVTVDLHVFFTVF